jgi:hypothetical protein
MNGVLCKLCYQILQRDVRPPNQPQRVDVHVRFRQRRRPVTHSIKLGPVAHSIKLGPVTHSIKLGPVTRSIKLGPVAHSIKLGPVAQTIQSARDLIPTVQSIKLDPS